MKCKRCQVEFAPKKPHAKFCSAVCRHKYRNELASKINGGTRVKKCPNCSRLFVERQSVYCSDFCRQHNPAAQFARKKYSLSLAGKERTKRYNKKRLVMLSDGIVKAGIIGKSKILKFKDIPNQLVELRRLQIQLRRLIRQTKNQNTQ